MPSTLLTVIGACGGVRMTLSAVLPCILADREPALRRLTPEVLGQQNLSIVYRRDVLLSKAVQTVMRFLAEIVRGHAKIMSG